MAKKPELLYECMSALRKFFSFFSFIIAVVLLSGEYTQQVKYGGLWILPLITGFFYLIPVYRTNHYIVDTLSLIVGAAIFLRNCISPLLLSVTNFSAEIDGGRQEYYNQSYVLLSLETFIILCIVYIQTRKLFCNSGKLELLYNLTEKKQLVLGKSFVPVLLIVGIFCLFFVFSSPSVLKPYAPIWAVQDQLDSLFRETTIYDTLFAFFWGIFGVMFVVYMVSLLCKFKKRNLVYLLTLAIVVFLPIFMTSENYGYVLISIVVTYVFAEYVLGKINIVFKFSVATLSFLVLFSVLLIKGYEGSAVGQSLWGEVSSFIQAYIPGVSNVSGIFKMTGAPKLTTLFYDFYYMIPFRNTLFGLPGDFRSVIFFNEANGVISQIIPCVGQCYWYFGYFGCIVSALPVAFSYSLAKRINFKVRSVDYILLFASVYCALTPFLYNYTILGSWLFMTLLPVYLVMYILLPSKIK